MSNTLLSLPIDVPWKRIAISADMYATTLDAFPPDWRSSIAVYAHQPDPDPLDTTGEITTFLKVVATITGFNWFWAVDKKAGVKLIQVFLNVFYPALSALVQVAVVPSGKKRDGSTWADVREFPYFTDFEPKKREVVEAATATGEVLTTNSPLLTVTKSTTTTPSTETDVPNTSAATSYTHNDKGTEGTSTVLTTGTMTKAFGPGGTVATEVTDASRERRETQSYTTNLSHVYQTLDSYHAGTNRAMFLVSARPHLIDSIYTFVRGPRRLEGIQEFFLVVRRPKEMPGICVKARLDTAHLDLEDPESTTVFITSRAVTGCSVGGVLEIGPSSPWVYSETVAPKTVGDLLKAAGENGPVGVSAANAIGRFVREEMTKSLSPGAGFPDGVVDIAHTQFGLRQIIRAIPQTVLQEQPSIRNAASKMMQTLLSPPSTAQTLKDLGARTEFLRSVGVEQPKVNQTPPSTATGLPDKPPRQQGVRLPSPRQRTKPAR